MGKLTSSHRSTSYPCFGQDLGDSEGANRGGLTRLQNYTFFSTRQNAHPLLIIFPTKNVVNQAISHTANFIITVCDTDHQAPQPLWPGTVFFNSGQNGESGQAGHKLIIRGFQADVGIVDYRTTGKDGKTGRKQYEVDFVANQGSQRYYIQSAFIMTTDAKERQESASLLNIDDSFNKNVVVKGHIKSKRNEEGIVTNGLFDFLLKPELLNWR